MNETLRLSGARFRCISRRLAGWWEVGGGTDRAGWCTDYLCILYYTAIIE